MVNWPTILNASVRKLPVHGHVTKILSYFQPWPYDLQCCPILVQMAFFQRVFCIMWHDINFDGHQKKTKPCGAVSSSVVHVSCQICILIGLYWIICIHIGSASILLNEHLSAPPGLGIFNCQIPAPEDWGYPSTFFWGPPPPKKKKKKKLFVGRSLPNPFSHPPTPGFCEIWENNRWKIGSKKTIFGMIWDVLFFLGWGGLSFHRIG